MNRIERNPLYETTLLIVTLFRQKSVRSQFFVLSY